MSATLTLLDRTFLKYFTEALFDGFEDMAISVDQVVDNFERILSDIGGTKAVEIVVAVGVLQLGMVPFFEDLPVARRRERIMRRLGNSTVDLIQDLAKVRSLLYAAYYGHWIDGDADANRDNPVHRQIGFTLPEHRTNRNVPDEVGITRWPGRQLAPAHFETLASPLDDIDVIVVGSGSGGSVAARNLTCQGHKVLIVEAGPHVASDQITHQEQRMTARLFKHGALQSTADNDLVIFQGRNVGGSPTVNNGICLRMKGDPLGHPDAADVFVTWRELGADLDESRFQDSYDAVQTYLSIRPAESRSGRSNGRHLLDAFASHASTSADPWLRGARSGWFNKNFGPSGTGAACAYCGYCNTGCPYDRKLGMVQSYLLDACTHGAKILPDTKVERIEWQRLPGGMKRANGVVVKGTGGATRFIPARKGVVVAAGTIASSLLLDRSGVDDTGRGISLNIAAPVVALMPPGGSPSWDEDQMTTVADCGEFLLESHFQPPMSMASLMSGWFGEMDRRMRLYGRQCSAGVLFPADRRGRIAGGKLRFKLTEEDLALLRKALATLTKVHFTGGALEVWPPLLKGQTLFPGDDIDGFYAEAIKEPDDVTLSSSHPHGGNPIHADPELGVVDTQCRLHGAENVLVTDASVFPSCIRVNAQFTTMAMAQYATCANPF